MKVKQLLYLSVALLLLPSLLAVGDTFSIVQGSLGSTEKIYFEVYTDNVYLFDSFEVSSINGFYALSITIPSEYSQLEIIPIIDGEKYFSKFTIVPGDTINLDMSLLDREETKTSTSIASSFKFQPEDNKKEIEDISKGNFEPYEEDIKINSIPSIVEETNGENKNEIIAAVYTENPVLIEQKDSFLEKVNAFFLQPIVLLILAVVACLLIVLVVLKEKRSEYL